MKRTLVDLEEQDLIGLDTLASKRNISRAAVLREAVAEYLIKRERIPAAQQQAIEGFGALKGHLADGQIYQNQLRAEWDTPQSNAKKPGKYNAMKIKPS